MNILVLGVSLLYAIPRPISAERFVLNGPECGFAINTRLIINGTDAAPRQFPWVVRVRSFISFNEFIGCGGTIITTRHVLTAAHCFKKPGKTVLNIDVLYGDNDVNKAKRVDVVKRLAHQHYTRIPKANDIAILLVKNPFQFSITLKPACLPSRPLNVVGKRVVTAGWGDTTIGGSSSDYLQYTIVNVLPDVSCQRTYGGNYLPNRMLCTHKEYTSTCSGDSGGPLFVRVKGGRLVLVGVTAYSSDPCGIHPHVFTRVDAYMPWIKKYIGNLRAYEDTPPHVSPMLAGAPDFEPYTFVSRDAELEPTETLFAL